MDQISDLGGLTSRLKATQISSAPIDILPIEILADIFRFGQLSCLIEFQDEDDDEWELERDIGLAFEVIVSHVSTFWRDIALDSRILWSRIYITLTTPPSRVDVYLARSGQAGLDININLTEIGFKVPTHTPEMLDAVVSQIGRWERCWIDCEKEQVDEPVVSRLANLSAPALEYLSICVPDIDDTITELRKQAPIEPACQILTAGCPNLKFVRMRGLAMAYFRPPVDHLHTLHLDQTTRVSTDYTIFYHFLLGSSSLTHLSIYGDIIHPQQPWPTSPAVQLDSLRSLRVCGVNGTVYSGILLSISAPNLEYLVLKGAQEQDLDLFWAVSQRQSGPMFPKLHSLTFYDFDVTLLTYNNLFTSFPAVTEFSSLKSSFNVPVILKALSYPSVIADAWPNLQTLAIILNFDEIPFIRDVLEKRSKCGLSLSKLRLVTSEDLDEWDIEMPEFQWLKQHLEVETLSRLERWPVGRDYLDVDDYFML
ncbi:hypothetical protein C8J56DRAFT_925502 [Mycena floridula]|nr:hypothetical protein C8J56DRAFT_925502 [Mycena floridula]